MDEARDALITFWGCLESGPLFEREGGDDTLAGGVLSGALISGSAKALFVVEHCQF